MLCSMTSSDYGALEIEKLELEYEKINTKNNVIWNFLHFRLLCAHGRHIIFALSHCPHFIFCQMLSINLNVYRIRMSRI